MAREWCAIVGQAILSRKLNWYLDRGHRRVKSPLATLLLYLSTHRCFRGGYCWRLHGTCRALLEEHLDNSIALRLTFLGSENTLMEATWNTVEASVYSSKEARVTTPNLW